MLKYSVPPSWSDAEGTNEYGVPTVTDVAGVPEIVGGQFTELAGATVIENGGNIANELPSLAAMIILGYTPAADGTPESVPRRLSKEAHAGLL
jgi:hypothetical protein